MTALKLSLDNNIAQINFNNGVTNPISTQFVTEFNKALTEVESNDCKGVIIKGGVKFFSMGLNLPELLNLNRSEMTEFFNRFDDICYRIFCLNKPTISILEGHTVAGGAVLALMTDYRYALGTDKLFGLNEIKIGVPVPYLTNLIVHAIAPPKTAKDMLYTGNFYSFSDMNAAGIIDEITAKSELEKAVIEKIRELATHNPQTFIAMKQNQIEKVKELYLKNKEQKNKEFIDCWFSPQTKQLLSEAAKNF